MRSPLCSVPLYPHNTLCTRNASSRTCTSDSHACQISSANFFLSGILPHMRLKSLAVCLPAYGYGPDTHLLRVSRSLFVRIASLVFVRSPLSVLHRSPVCGISVQTRYDICNSNSYVLNCYCHLFDIPPIGFCLQLLLFLYIKHLIIFQQ